MRRLDAAITHFLVYGIALLACGCGTRPPQTATVERQFFTIMDEAGRERIAPAEELFGETASAGRAVRILVLDRETGSETWVPLAELGRETPALARYVPRPRTQAQASASASAAQ